MQSADEAGGARSGLMFVQPSGAWHAFGVAPLIEGWPSVRAWVEAWPVAPIVAVEGGDRVIEVETESGAVRGFRLTPVAADDGEGRGLRIEPAERPPNGWLRAALDIVDASVWSIDTEMRLTAGNRAFGDLCRASLGRPIDIGAHLLETAPTPESETLWRDVYTRALAGQEVDRDLDEDLLTTVEPTLMKLSARPIRHEGRVTGAACFLRDHSESHRQSAALERQNALLDALARVQSRLIGQGQSVGVYNELLDTLLELTGSPFGFLGETRAGDDGQPVLVVTAISDVSWDEASRKRYLSAFAGEMRFENLDTLFGAVIETERPVLSNDVARDARAGGVPPGHFAVETYLGLPCHVGGRLVGMVSVANRPGGYDGSLVSFLQPLLRAFGNIVEARHGERRRQEAELALQRAKEAAENADRAKGDFLASMSHEIRTPLNAVLGLCELALDAAIDPDQRSLLKAARSNSETLLNLISDILDFSRIDAGLIELDEAPFDLRRLVEEVAETMALRAASDGVAVVAAVQPVLPAPMLGDVHRIRQVLTNLAANAVKYTEHGEVRIEVAVERRGGRADVRIEVIDTGLGIPADEQARIFERFHRVAATAGVGGGGTGLGLSITKILVEHMGGHIEVDSVPGRGSRFTVELPLGLPSDALDDGPPEFLLSDVRVALVHPGGGDGPQIVRLLTAFGAEVEQLRSMAGLDDADFDVILTVGTPTESDRPVVRLGPVGSLGRSADDAYRLTLPVRRDALLEVVIAATGLDRSLERSPSLHPVPEVTHSLVLLVEDHPDNRAVARRHLERQGHLVEVAEHGGIAVAMARETAYDLILMDLHMPHLDGFEATRAIRADEERMGVRPVPIVAVTAHATADVRQRCFETGIDGFVPKPVTGAILIETVERFAYHDPVALVVDDAPDSLRLLTRHLRRELPLRLRLAVDGASARELAINSPPALALVDATLPDESGFELAAWLRETVGPGLILLMVTGRTDTEARRLADAAGCNGYVTKPVDRRLLFSEIERHMGRTRRRPPTSRSGALLEPATAPAARVAHPTTEGEETDAGRGPGREPTTEPETADAVRSLPPVGPQITEPMPQLGLALDRAGEAPSQPPVEVAYVDPDLLDLIPPFLQDRRNDLAAIDAALDAGDMTTIARLGHSMKGTGRAYGMPHVSALGRQIEEAARQGDLEGLRGACAELATYVDTVHVLPEE